MLQFLLEHQALMATLAGGGVGTAAWSLFSTIMQACPPLPQNAGWWVTWIHDAAQKIAVNPNKLHASQG